jgi:hypothetical protein
MPFVDWAVRRLADRVLANARVALRSQRPGLRAIRHLDTGPVVRERSFSRAARARPEPGACTEGSGAHGSSTTEPRAPLVACASASAARVSG